MKAFQISKAKSKFLKSKISPENKNEAGGGAAESTVEQSEVKKVEAEIRYTSELFVKPRKVIQK